MEQAVIFILVAAFLGMQAVFKKLKAAQENSEVGNQPPAQTPPAQSSKPAYDVDQRYQDIQEEIRRRIAQRAQETSPTPAAQTTAPRTARPKILDTGLPPKTPPQPISKYQRPTAPTAAEAAATSAMAMPSGPSSPNADLLEIYGSLAATEADTTADARPAPTPGASLRTLLASPKAARQAFILREILDRPLSLRPAGCGGHHE